MANDSAARVTPPRILEVFGQFGRRNALFFCVVIHRFLERVVHKDVFSLVVIDPVSEELPLVLRVQFTCADDTVLAVSSTAFGMVGADICIAPGLVGEEGFERPAAFSGEVVNGAAGELGKAVMKAVGAR